MLFLPGGCPKLATLREVITLTQLFLAGVAAHQRVAMLVDAVGEVLAGHAKAGTFPTLQVPIVDEAPILHTNQRKYACTTPGSVRVATHACPSAS